jgi:hypothetical protein
MTIEEKTNLQTSIKTADRNARHRILHSVKRLEFYVNRFIAEHFVLVENKNFELMICGLSSVSLEHKRQTFIQLVSHYRPEFFKDNPEFDSRIEPIIEAIKAFTHNRVDLSDTAIELYDKEKIMGFTPLTRHYEQKFVSSIKYSEENLNDLQRLIEFFIERLKTLHLMKS